MLPLLLALASLAAAQPKQLVYFDTLGRKGGILEVLYAQDGPADIETFMSKQLGAAGDSIFIIIEAPDYARAVVVEAAYQPDKSLRGSGGSFTRRGGTAKCAPAAMAAAQKDFRVNQCYFDAKEYDNDASYPNLGYDSGADFARKALAVIEEFIPVTPTLDFIDSKPGLRAKFDEARDVYRTNKLVLVLAKAVLHEAGWRKDLTDPSGWSQTAAPDPQLRKLIAGVRRLEAEGKVFLSINTGCAQIGTGGRIVDRSTLKDGACRPMTLMGEYLDSFYAALEADGLRYDEASEAWKRP